MSKMYLLATKQLHPTNNGDFNYCPYCLKEWKKQNENRTNVNYRDVLTPIQYKKYLVVSQDKEGKEVKWLDEYWECSRCSRHLVTEDFVLNYCRKSDGSKYKEDELERIDSV